MKLFIITEEQAKLVFNALGDLPGKIGFHAMSTISNLPALPMPKKTESTPESTPTENEPKAETVATALPGNGRSPKTA